MNKIFIVAAVCVIVAFHLGMNVGRDRPTLSNPYADAVKTAKGRAGQVIEHTKEAIHEATKPITK